jgi:hypothetical protein
MVGTATFWGRDSPLTGRRRRHGKINVTLCRLVILLPVFLGGDFRGDNLAGSVRGLFQSVTEDRPRRACNRGKQQLGHAEHGLARCHQAFDRTFPATVGNSLDVRQRLTRGVADFGRNVRDGIRDRWLSLGLRDQIGKRICRLFWGSDLRTDYPSKAARINAGLLKALQNCIARGALSDGFASVLQA